MSFPIHRADLNNVESPNLNLDSVVLPSTATFIDNRVLTLSKQITAAALEGKKTCNLTIIIPQNVYPVCSGLVNNFPDVNFSLENQKMGQAPISIMLTQDGISTLSAISTLSVVGGLRARGNRLTVDWS